MGYIYRINPHTGYPNLVCDRCGNIGGVRKRRCPFGYCQSLALCPSCWSELRSTWRDRHIKAGCEENNKRFMEEQRKRMEIIENGGLLRVAALSHGDRVKVIFRSKERDKAFFMSSDTYNAYPLGEPHTLEDYRDVGEVVEATDDDIYSPV